MPSTPSLIGACALLPTVQIENACDWGLVDSSLFLDCLGADGVPVCIPHAHRVVWHPGIRMVCCGAGVLSISLFKQQPVQPLPAFT